MAWRRRDGRTLAAYRRILPVAWGCRGFAQWGAGRPRWPQGRAAPRAMDLSPCLHWVRTRLWRCGARRRRFFSKCCVQSPRALTGSHSSHHMDRASTEQSPVTPQHPPHVQGSLLGCSGHSERAGTTTTAVCLSPAALRWVSLC